MMNWQGFGKKTSWLHQGTVLVTVKPVKLADLKS